MKQYYKIGGHTIAITDGNLIAGVKGLSGFGPFSIENIEGQPVCCTFQEGTGTVPPFDKIIYELNAEDVFIQFGTTKDGYRLKLNFQDEQISDLYTTKDSDLMHIQGSLAPRLLRFALWIGYNIAAVNKFTIAMHSSCIVYENKAVLFLGESGTGKSTHTGLWRKHIPNTLLLNDDSPILRVEDNEVWIYGSPWSGKTPCYKPLRYRLQGCVRLSQGSQNQMRKLSVLESFAALHPSCPPAFAYDSHLYEAICKTLDKVLRCTPCYHLSCLPDKEAALLSCKTLFEK